MAQSCARPIRTENPLKDRQLYITLHILRSFQVYRTKYTRKERKIPVCSHIKCLDAPGCGRLAAI